MTVPGVSTRLIHMRNLIQEMMWNNAKSESKDTNYKHEFSHVVVWIIYMAIAQINKSISRITWNHAKPESRDMEYRVSKFLLYATWYIH